MPDKTGIMIATALGGGVLVWSGINNKGVLTTVRDLLQGNKPVAGPAQSFSVNLGSFGSSGSTGVAGNTGNVVADTALKYQGSSYVWGGAPGTVRGQDKGTDCSGFANMVIGRDLGMAIPGFGAGQYNGSGHGPPTGGWLLWNGVTGITLAQLQPGDLIVWQTHMGIAIGGGQMISALNTSLGVKITTIKDGAPVGEIPFYKRLGGNPVISPTGTNINTPNPVITKLP